MWRRQATAAAILIDSTASQQCMSVSAAASNIQ
jgi:hypothetical protein